MLESLKDIFHNTPWLAVLAVFIVGAAASLSSCTLIRLPVVFGYVAGASSREKSLRLPFFFSAGLVTSYTILGLLLIALKSVTMDLLRVSSYAYQVIGIFLLVSGGCFAGLFSFHILTISRCIPLKFNEATPLGAFSFGMFFALLEMPACPCCSSLIFVLAGLVGFGSSAIYAFLVFFSFALGQSVPVFLIGSSAALMNKMVSQSARFEKYIQLFAGVSLVMMGLFFILIA